MAQHNRNNWHHIPGIGGIMATGLSTFIQSLKQITGKLPKYYIRDLKI